MAPPGSSEDENADHAYVHCASCGARAASSWSFCRSCRSTLDDARPPKDGVKQIGAGEALDMEDYGCPKCGHEAAETDEVATTGTGLTKLFDLQNRRFQAVSCTNCGYTEFYRGHDADLVLDLFFGG